VLPDFSWLPSRQGEIENAPLLLAHEASGCVEPCAGVDPGLREARGFHTQHLLDIAQADRRYVSPPPPLPRPLHFSQHVADDPLYVTITSKPLSQSLLIMAQAPLDAQRGLLGSIVRIAGVAAGAA
jgi:hypothetical protein